MPFASMAQYARKSLNGDGHWLYHINPKFKGSNPVVASIVRKKLVNKKFRQ